MSRLSISKIGLNLLCFSKISGAYRGSSGVGREIDVFAQSSECSVDLQLSISHAPLTYTFLPSENARIYVHCRTRRLA